MTGVEKQVRRGGGSRIHYLSASTLPSRAANSVHVMKMCEAFSRHGCAVTLFARGAGVSVAEVFSHYGVPALFQIALAPAAGGRIGRMPMRVNGYRKAINRLPDADLIYGRDVFSLWLLAHLRGRPFVFEAHHPPTTGLQAVLLRSLMSSSSLRGVVTISERLRQEWMQRFPGVKPGCIHVAHDGADCPEQIRPHAIPGVRNGKHQIGYVGSLYNGRGIEIILAVAARFPEVDVHLVGGSQSEIDGWNAAALPANIHFHGHVPYREIPGWLAAFDILLAPYQRRVQIGTGLDTVDWMSPLKIFEYMASGQPIVVSDLPVLREVLRHNENCLLVEPQSVESWCEAISYLLLNPDGAERLAQAARTDLKRQYSWYVRAGAVLQALGLKQAGQEGVV